MKGRSQKCSITIQETVGVVQKGILYNIEYLVVLTVLLVVVAITVDR